MRGMPAGRSCLAHVARAASVSAGVGLGFIGVGCGDRQPATPMVDAAIDVPVAPARPNNPTCLPPARAVTEGLAGLPADLVATGCFEMKGGKPAPVAAAIPYAVNAPLWSDGASKDRWLALPDDGRIHVNTDGDFALPPNSVLIKTFRFGERPIETRFYVRHPDGNWSGYAYAWNESGTNAALVDEGSRRLQVGDRAWHLPSRAECDTCHTESAGRSLGLELGQLDRDFDYPGNARANQLATWAAMGLFDAPLPKSWARLPAPDEASVDIDTRARAYLHANCANCHRPGVGNSGTSDLRFETPLGATKICDQAPVKGTLGHGIGVRLLAPGQPETSMLLLRMRALDSTRMPTVASLLVDDAGVGLISAWIAGFSTCP
jgi:uncharacterized repeat protein (TIGR03806 family)